MSKKQYEQVLSGIIIGHVRKIQKLENLREYTLKSRIFREVVPVIDEILETRINAEIDILSSKIEQFNDLRKGQ